MLVDGNRLKAAIARFPPGYFSLVMATGIVSIAAHSVGLTLVAAELFRINIAFYIILWALTFARIIIDPRSVAVDLCSHVSGPSFFTMIAGTCVLGGQFALLRESSRAAGTLLLAGTSLWIGLFYAVFMAMIVKQDKPPLSQSVNGSWLLAAVATESIAVLGSLVAAKTATYPSILLFGSLCMFLVGGMLYAVIIAFIVYRLLFDEMPAESLAPAYWINMGALAITALAGGTLATTDPSPTLIHLLLPFVVGLSIASWAGASCWILLLVLLGLWRHGIMHVRIVYSHEYWSLVFPLGMYTACTFPIAQVVDLSFLSVIPRYAIYAALCAWALTSIGLLRALWKWAVRG